MLLRLLLAICSTLILPSASESTLNHVDLCDIRGVQPTTGSYNEISDPSLRDLSGCGSQCWADERCKSFAISAQSCLLYMVPLAGNLRKSPESSLRYYERYCRSSLPSEFTPPVIGTRRSLTPSLYGGIPRPADERSRETLVLGPRSPSMCGVVGWDSNATPLQILATDNPAVCLSSCQSYARCWSFSVGQSTCRLYALPLSAFFSPDPKSQFLFYDSICRGTLPKTLSTATSIVAPPPPTSGPVVITSLITSVITTVVTTVVTSILTTLSTQLPPTPRISSTDSIGITFGWTTSPPPRPFTSLPPTSFTIVTSPLLPSSSAIPTFISTRTTRSRTIQSTSLGVTSDVTTPTVTTQGSTTSDQLPSTPATPLLCGVTGWSAANTTFYDSSGAYGSQSQCASMCRAVSCGSYGFGSGSCLVYIGGVSQSITKDPNSVYTFFDAGCTTNRVWT